MNRLLTIWVFFITCTLTTTAQNTFTFKVQVVHHHLGLQKKARVLINNQIPAITDENGIFRVVLPRRTSGIKVTLTQGDFQVLYPPGGFVSVPRDLNDIPQVVVGSAKDNPYLQQYLNVYRLRKNTSGDRVPDLQKKMDSLRNLLQLFRYSDNDLKKAEHLQDGRDTHYPLIVSDITDYLEKTNALLTAFRLLHPLALDHPVAMQQLVEAGKEYSERYLKLYREHLNYQRRLSEFWQDDSLTAAYADLVAYALNKLHAEKIFPIQTVILQMKQFSTAKKKKAKERKPIEQLIQKELTDIDTYYTPLQRKTYEVIERLDD